MSEPPVNTAHGAPAQSTGRPTSALLLVDVQNDFCRGGALAVPGSERVVIALNRYIEEATVAGMLVYASRDWHPAGSVHFAPYGGEWPVHCVADTSGAAFHPNLNLPGAAIVVSKGTQPDEHGYSALHGRTPSGIPLLDDLIERWVRHVFVGGLATDYCVKHSVIDVLSAGIAVTVLEDAIAGVDRTPGDAERALSAMRAHGARVVSSIDRLIL